MTTQEAYSRGFDAGNYGAAYESEDFEQWEQEHKRPAELPERGRVREAYEHGLTLGFFSSFELHEISDEQVRETVETLRLRYEEN